MFYGETKVRNCVVDGRKREDKKKTQDFFERLHDERIKIFFPISLCSFYARQNTFISTEHNFPKDKAMLLLW